MSRLIIFLFYIVSLLYGFQLKKFHFQLNHTDEITKGTFFFFQQKQIQISES